MICDLSSTPNRFKGLQPAVWLERVNCQKPEMRSRDVLISYSVVFALFEQGLNIWLFAVGRGLAICYKHILLN